MGDRLILRLADQTQSIISVYTNSHVLLTRYKQVFQNKALFHTEKDLFYLNSVT